MPGWSDMHIFPRAQEEATLARWAGPEARRVVLAVVDALEELAAGAPAEDRHVDAFLASAEAEDRDPRAWLPGLKRILQGERLSPARFGPTVERLTRDPRTAARVLSWHDRRFAATDAVRARAMETLLAAAPEERAAAVEGEHLRGVRMDVQMLLPPRPVDVALRDLEEETRLVEPVVLHQELAHGLRAEHAGRVLAYVERYPEGTLGGFLDDLVELAAAVAPEAVLASFRRNPTFAVALHLRWTRDELRVVREALDRTDLPEGLRRALRSMCEPAEE